MSTVLDYRLCADNLVDGNVLFHFNNDDNL